jgi:hypothetical protein
MFLLKPKLLLIAFLLIGFRTVVSAQSSEPLVAAWVEEDIASVAIVLNLLPFENQSISQIKARLKDTWSVEEQDFGFGGKRLDIGKGNGYTKMFVKAFLFNGRVAYYELGIESYSKEWPRIRDDIVDAWRKTTDVEPDITQHHIAYRKTLEPVLASYRTAVLARLGEMKPVEVPADLRGSYDLLTSFMGNSAVSDGGCGLPPGLPSGKVAIDQLIEHDRFDLIENVARGYNPGARVYAVLALLEKQKQGGELKPETKRAIRQIVNLRIRITTCAGCFVYHETAKKVLADLRQ